MGCASEKVSSVYGSVQQRAEPNQLCVGQIFEQVARFEDCAAAPQMPSPNQELAHMQARKPPAQKAVEHGLKPGQISAAATDEATVRSLAHRRRRGAWIHGTTEDTKLR